MELIFIWLAIATVTGLAANGRGRSFAGWFVLGLIFAVFALIAVLVMPRANDLAAQAQESGKDEQPPSVIARHKGQNIGVRGGTYWVGQRQFRTEADAKQHIDAEARRKNGPETATSYQPKRDVPRALGDGMFDQMVVGTSNYQQAIKDLPRQRGKFIVTLHCQNENRHDSNAVAVLHGTDLLGFLPREDAADWREELADCDVPGADVQAYARIARSDEHETLRLRLDLEWPVRLLASQST